MANPFALLGDDENDDPQLLAAKKPVAAAEKKAAVAKAGESKKSVLAGLDGGQPAAHHRASVCPATRCSCLPSIPISRIRRRRAAGGRPDPDALRAAGHSYCADGAPRCLLIPLCSCPGQARRCW